LYMAGKLFNNDKPLTVLQEVVILIMEDIIMDWKIETKQLL